MKMRVRKMRMTYDKEADAAYIHVKDSIAAGEVAKTIALDENINLDFDRNEKLLGIEILSASKVLPEKQLVASN
jgi:uncharacterized protein YuzE